MMQTVAMTAVVCRGASIRERIHPAPVGEGRSGVVVRKSL